ncbi:CaiB/BaiF CoA transferase family protein [Paenarthrobacter sp. NPDC091711]|uniref:CaiB/BaiF CoA transferase family protein n=1 Tax=Paenarthrobacter sp. NPDC091711 TaxID=3364385 RepID=UPI00380DD521
MSLRLLKGIRVVSIEQFISAPYCTSMLADSGAEVIKIERPGSGDPRRSYDPKLGPEDDYLSGGFVSYNRGKKSVELDLSDPNDGETFEQLLRDADVFVHNLRPGSLAKLGWGADELRKRFPHMVVCEISGFGVTGGPYAKWPALDSVIQGMSGLSSLLGTSPAAPPGLAPMGTMDILAGVYAAVGILAALVQLERTGQGSHVDAAMYDIGAAFLERPLTLHEFTGELPARGQDNYSPVATFQTGDSAWISIVIPTDDMWARTCRAIERPDLTNHLELDTSVKRAARMRDTVVPALELWARGLSADECLSALRAAGQPAGLVQSIAQVRACPQLAHRELFVDVEDPRAVHDDGRHIALPRLPLLFDGRRAEPGAVPRLGAHNETTRQPESIVGHP